ncbi:hypothetical protein N9L00_00695 [Flavobacteriaceae bacterium]|jgi:uncharacterized membrane protein AbrB (regulator of aidB expression)|nr:hypothetical protein [Flavobacteriaceae bacterium]
MNLNISKKVLYPLSLLIIPLLGVILTNSVEWSMFDFLLMGSLLLVLGIGIELTSLNFKQLNTRIAIISFIILLFLLIWIELAVGIFNSPFAGN